MTSTRCVYSIASSSPETQVREGDLRDLLREAGVISLAHIRTARIFRLEESMGRTLIRTWLVMGWIPTLALMMGANWMTRTLAFAQGPAPVKVTRLYTGPDGKTKVEEYEIQLKPQGRGPELSQIVPVKSVQFRRTNKDYDLD